MQVEYVDPIIEADAIAEAWIEKRGRSTVFCRVEVRTPPGTLTAIGSLIYKVSSRPRPTA
jgi:acyl-coenzyme A thioesterase PaaI-like protein